MQYYLARDDGEVFGPYADKGGAIIELCSTMANDPDSREPWATDAHKLSLDWDKAFNSTIVQYEAWQRAVLDLAESLDWNIYGVEFILGTETELFGDRLHFDDEISAGGLPRREVVNEELRKRIERARP